VLKADGTLHVWEDPKREEVEGGVVADGTTGAKILLGAIKDGFCERHCCAGVSH
jgi:hypothetical protein